MNAWQIFIFITVLLSKMSYSFTWEDSKGHESFQLAIILAERYMLLYQ